MINEVTKDTPPDLTNNFLPTKRGFKMAPVAKMLRHSHEKTTFLASNRSWGPHGHRSVRYNTDLPPPSHSKLFLQVLGMVLYC